MKIYFPHSTSFDFHTEWYDVIRSVQLESEYFLPHEKNNEQFPSRTLLESDGCDLVIAEVSYPSLGLGIELGWASAYGVPIIALHKEGHIPSGSIYAVTHKIHMYQNIQDLGHILPTLL